MYVTITCLKVQSTLLVQGAEYDKFTVKSSKGLLRELQQSSHEILDYSIWHTSQKLKNAFLNTFCTLPKNHYEMRHKGGKVSLS